MNKIIFGAIALTFCFTSNATGCEDNNVNVNNNEQQRPRVQSVRA